MTNQPIRPEITDLTRPYWDGARLGELRVQRCQVCDVVWHPPQPRCARCRGQAIEWIAVSGRGTVHSCTTVHHAVHPSVEQRVPYVVAMIRLDEGPLVVSNLPSMSAIGTRVAVTFETVADDIVLPHFYPEPVSEDR